MHEPSPIRIVFSIPSNVETTTHRALFPSRLRSAVPSRWSAATTHGEGAGPAAGAAAASAAAAAAAWARPSSAAAPAASADGGAAVAASSFAVAEEEEVPLAAVAAAAGRDAGAVAGALLPAAAPSAGAGSRRVLQLLQPLAAARRAIDWRMEGVGEAGVRHTFFLVVVSIPLQNEHKSIDLPLSIDCFHCTHLYTSSS